MKILLLVFYFCFSANSFSQAPLIADSVAKRFNISRVTGILKYPFHKTTCTDYYDRTGKRTKSEKADSFEKEKTVISYNYHNGLLINAVVRVYCEGKLCETTNTAYTYNKENRRTGSTTSRNKNNILKDTIIYNDAMNIDTIHSYSKDTSIYNPGRRSYDTRLTKNFHETQVVINYYDQDENKRREVVYSYSDREGCMRAHRPAPADSIGYTTTEFYVSGDTAIQKVTSRTCWKVILLYKSVHVSRNETYRDDAGSIVRIIDKFNKLNLISTRNISTIQRGYKEPLLSVITYQYFYYTKK